MTNRLAQEISPYLLQHAANPVDWYPWCEEALDKARAEDRPIFLSIGYSACHWCHVMAHESFEDPDTAAVMNEEFVNIKVDREERPDLDSIYMEAVVAMTGRGGWPMSVFLTPDGVPFYGGTYFPANDQYGMPGFRRVLLSVAQAYRDKKDEFQEWREQISNQLAQTPVADGNLAGLEPAVLDEAYERLAVSFDAVHGGFGQAPKFPQPMNLEFLLRYYHRTGQERALEMVEVTLSRMAAGGIYDQLGGGFHRYSVDAQWLVPHFEKMLYDNALLTRVYLHAWQVTGHPLYRRVVEETLDYVMREMTHPGGGFYSAQDADSEGEEGKFYVWTWSELNSALGEETAAIFARFYDVTPGGNFEGRNILNIKVNAAALIAEMGLDEDAFEDAIDSGCRKLFELRQEREKPGRDDKVLTAWNGLMLAAFSEASRVLGRDDYRQVAESNARFVLNELMCDGRLLRSWKAGSAGTVDQARYNAYLEDYAFLADGLLALYQATFDWQWLDQAQLLADLILEHFSDERGGFFDTSDDHEALIVRPKQLQDNAIPSGNAMAVEALLKLAAYTGLDKYRRPAEAMLAAMNGMMRQYPGGFGQWLGGLAFYLAAPHEIAIVGDIPAEDTQALLDVVFGPYRPYQVVALATPGDNESYRIPLLADRPQREGKATAYVCRSFVCTSPVTDPAALAENLD